MGAFVGLEALLVARVFLVDGRWEDDEGVDFRGDESGGMCRACSGEPDWLC